MQIKTADTKVLKKIFSTIKGQKRYLTALLIFQMGLAVIGVAYAYFLRNIIDAAVAKNRQELILNVIGLSSLALVQLILRLIIHFLNEYSRASIENSLKKSIIGSILNKEYSFVTRTHSGEWLNRLTNDTIVVANGLTDIFPGFISMIIRMVAAFAFLIYFVPKFALFIAVCGVALIGFTMFFRKVSKRLHNDVQASDGKLRIFLTEQLNALMIIKAYGAENKAVEGADDLMTEHKKKRMRKNRFSNIASSGFAFAMNLLQVLSALYCGSMILTGDITSYGTFTAVMQLIGQIQSPIANISGFLPRYYAMIASAERIFEAQKFLDDSSASFTENVEEFYNKDFIDLGFSNAEFSYFLEEDSRKNVIKNISFDIKKGEFVAFTGPSGCGKSTVLKLLLSLYKLDAGEVYITTSSGKDSLTSAHRSLFSYVPQGNVLMNGTIREVVSFFDEKIDDERVQNAIKIACADTFVDLLPNGIETQLGERGSGLSEGEMQRIAIARAIYSNKPILLLDEATSALDEKTEEALLSNLKTMTDKTVIIVTHRNAVTKVVDKNIRFSEKGVVYNGN